LLPPLCARLGAAPANDLTSGLFAIPHAEPWSVLGTFLVGLLLGAVYVASGSISLCIGLHAGLNLASLACRVELEHARI
jgi:membrane protease YdiL (CAAX protease family)